MPKVNSSRINKLIDVGEENAWRFPIKPSKIYVATTLAEQPTATRVAMLLLKAGFNVTSRWLEFDFSTRFTPERGLKNYVDQQERWGRTDLEDLEEADTLVILAHEPSVTGGYHVELGYFLGRGRENILVVGERRNVFYWTNNVRFLPQVDGVVEWLLSPEHGHDGLLNKLQAKHIFPGDVA